MISSSGNVLGLLRLALWPPTTFPGFDMLMVGLVVVDVRVRVYVSVCLLVDVE